jgi:hypothetical protein
MQVHLGRQQLQVPPERALGLQSTEMRSINTRLVLSTAAALLVGLAAGIWGTRAARGAADQQVVEELRMTRKVLSDLASRDSKAAPAPALTTIIHQGPQDPSERPGEPDKARASTSRAANSAEPTESNWAAFDAGHKLVAAALTSGRWSLQDQRTFRSLGAEMTSAQFFELNKNVAAAVNRDRLVLEEPGSSPP